MIIKVFNRETASIEKIDSAKINPKIHVHLNTHREFTKEELEKFNKIVEKETQKENKIDIKEIKAKLKEKGINFFAGVKDEKIIELAKQNSII